MYAYDYIVNSAVMTPQNRLELCRFGDFCFVASEAGEDSTGLRCFFVMLALANAADGSVRKQRPF